MGATRAWLFGTALAACAGAVAWFGLGLLSPLPGTQAPEVLGQVGEFTLLGHDGKPFGSKNLEGRIWIADFIFSRCTGPCPVLTGRMKQLDRTIADREVRLVTFSVDPTHDTPAVLRAYAKKRGLDLGRWTFVTGTLPGLKALLRDRMKLPLGPPGWNGDDYVIPHTEKFVLVDRTGGIRGYYDTADGSELGRLARDLSRL